MQNWISKKQNLFKIEFQNGDFCSKLNFKKAKFVENWISKRRNLLKIGFQNGDFGSKLNFKKAKFAEKLNFKGEIC